jgi:2-keto-4-pentenoate hydratase/2-oxohepta-3-ene-1,7-dioic acid hydratase in catechol pathway
MIEAPVAAKAAAAARNLVIWSPPAGDNALTASFISIFLLIIYFIPKQEESIVKLATFRSRGKEKIGVVHSHDSRLFDLATAADRDGKSNPAFASMLQLIDAGPSALDQAQKLFDKGNNDESLSENVGGAEILAPIPEPRQMRDGMSFPLHILQAPRGQLKLAARARNDMAELARIEAEPPGELPEIYRKQPIYYITNRFSVRGTNTTVKWPRYSKVMDYELEFGIITKNKGANIPASKAKDHIFGYTIFNDFSARDAQRIEMEGRLGPAKGKSFDGGNVMGPWIVTPDEIGDPYKLKVEARVNGKMRSQGVTEGMLFSFEEIIAHVTKDETLMPGEFIGSGTVGNGCGLELGWFLEHGDTIELDVEKIGVLKNKVERQDA